MSFFDNENKEFNTKNILPIIGATIGVVLTLGAAGVALSPLLSMKIAGCAAGFASALGLTTLGVGLVFGAIFAIVAVASIYQMFTNKAMAKAQASINAQAQAIKEAQDSIETQAADIKKDKDSINAQATEAFGVAIRNANIPNQVTVAITAADIPGQATKEVEAAIKNKNLVDQGALNGAIEGFATQANFEGLKAQVENHNTELGQKADTSALVGLVSQADFGSLKDRVNDHEDALGATLKTADLGTEIMSVLKTTDNPVMQHLNSIYKG